MNKKFQLLIGFLIIALVIIACGSSTNIQVNTPTESTNIQESTSVVIATSQNTEQPKATATTEIGTTRSNPAPVGSEVVVDDMAFEILNIIRPADSVVIAGNMFNSTPEADKEYLFVEMKITCKKTVDEKCSFNPTFSTKLVGSKGIEYEPEIFISGVEKILDSSDFYGNAVISGYIPFIVSKDETNFVLAYAPLLGSNFYLAIPESPTK